ncbi:MAG TPA: acyl-CoA desaturase, partial [Pseudonocardiaceae bacterium]|nr:acyl-CoA desaturase [Pseudonocardiaceae bacterium]
MSTSLSSPPAAKPLMGADRTPGEHGLVHVFILVPFLALVAAVPLAWGWGLTWLDVELAGGFYVLTGLAVTVGFHRHFTHGAFKAARPLRIALAAVGVMAVQGPVTEWVADHRRHHAFSDRDGDPHSPWRYGTSPAALTKGFWHAHLGWIFDRGKTNLDRFAPDLVADRDIVAVDRLFVLWTVLTLGLPPLLAGLITWSWWGAVTGLFWAGLVRISLLHHVTWSVNSVCHMIGARPFASRDKA